MQTNPAPFYLITQLAQNRSSYGNRRGLFVPLWGVRYCHGTTANGLSSKQCSPEPTLAGGKDLEWSLPRRSLLPASTATTSTRTRPGQKWCPSEEGIRRRIGKPDPGGPGTFWVGPPRPKSTFRISAQRWSPARALARQKQSRLCRLCRRTFK